MQLRPIASPWLETEAISFESLARFFDLAKSSEPHWEHTVAWVDCLSGARGRGVFLRARPAPVGQGAEAPQNSWPRSRELPLAPPLSLVNAGTLRLLNTLYRLSKTSKKGIQIEHQRKFLQPLDVINNWNLIYGRKGFYQYQALLPMNHGEAALSAMLKDIECSGEGSFLATLKVFGPREPRGLMSFVRGGITLALDFPNRGETTSKLFDRLDDHVRDSGGRLYFAKDARMSRSLFEAGYPRLCEFLSYRDIGISSAMSRRLLGS
jgi:hypothetical protein